MSRKNVVTGLLPRWQLGSSVGTWNAQQIAPRAWTTMATLQEQEAMATAIQQWNARIQQQETAMTILAQGRERLAQQVQSMVSTPRQRVQAGVVDTGDRKPRPVRRGSDEVCGLTVPIEIVPRSRGSAVSREVDDDRDIADSKTQREPQERGKHTQHADVLHSGDDNCRSRVGQVSQCRRVRGVKAWRQWNGNPSFGRVCKTPDERPGVQIPRRHSNQVDNIRENHVQDYENQST